MMPPAFVVACWPTIENTATAFGLRVTFSRIVIVPVTVAGSASAWTAGNISSATSAIVTSPDSLRSMRLLNGSTRDPTSGCRLPRSGKRARHAIWAKPAGDYNRPQWRSISITRRPRPCAPRCSRRCCPSSAARSATRRRRTRSVASRARPSTTRTSGSPRAIGADAREIVFTSGGTEANNLALKGAAWAGRARGHRIVTTRRRAPRRRPRPRAPREVRLRGRRGTGRPLRPSRPRRTSSAAITDRTILVSVMLANNEVGTIQPIADVAEVVRASRGRAVPCRRRPGRAVGRPRRRRAGRRPRRARPRTRPKARRASGALWIRRGTHILAQQHGGSQERHRRAGTENVAGAVGMARGVRARPRERDAHGRRASARSATGSTAALPAVDGVEADGPPGRAPAAHRCR